MPSEFIVRVTLTAPFENDRPAGGALTREYRFSRLPISIGRSQSNDLEIPSHFVSGRHARIEQIGGTLCVRDLGSRNGVHILLGAESVRVPSQSAYPVSPDGFELQLGSETRVQVEPSWPSTREPPRPALSDLGDGLPPLPDLGRLLRSLPPLDAPLGAAGPEAGSCSLPLIPQRDRGGEPVAANPAAFRSPPGAGFEPVRAGAAGHPRSPAQGHTAGFRTGNFDLGPEVLALQGLRELIASLSPGRTLDTRGDVARLVQRLHDVLEVVCRSYLSLRDGHATFVAKLQLQSSAEHDPARSALDAARDPSAVAALLLDFREPAAAASHALELALKELGSHQVALLDGMLQGIRALLEELSPESIQREVEQERSAPRLGRPERALWDEYCRRHARFSQDGEAFSRVFGEEFASAYRRYQHSRRPR